jgi:levansucrase
MTSAWTADAVAGIPADAYEQAPVISGDDVRRILPGYDLWDYWPVQERDGRTAAIAGGTLYMFLSAPAGPDPEDRHGIARIRLIHHRADAWHDLGPLLPDGFSPGSREWSGSAFVDADHRYVTLYFTAAGRRGETMVSFEQRLFETEAALAVVDDVPVLKDWSVPQELVAADGIIYEDDMAGGGAIGTIKAFRDPFWFCDPANGADYILFSGSLAASSSHWNGAIGLAKRGSRGWELALPLITADGLNNELERPHIVHHDGRYHCFWSTQRKVFAANGPQGPTGLYGMVADKLCGPWRPLNGTGLVFGNPRARPIQAYSWQVLADLSVISFADRLNLTTEPSDTQEARAHFGGTAAPEFKLILAGDTARLA